MSTDVAIRHARKEAMIEEERRPRRLHARSDADGEIRAEARLRVRRRDIG